MNWRTYYKLPLRYDWGYVWACNEIIALRFDTSFDTTDGQKAVDKLNGHGDFKIPDLNFDGIDFFDGDTYIFCIRSWGGLTGNGGGLGLSGSEAAIIQDTFSEYVFKKLKE